jgi:uncharacterized protein (DUF488 family)
VTIFTIGHSTRPIDEFIHQLTAHGVQRFIDYMQTREFEESLERCVELVREKRIALMCAESVPWRCHRSLIADALLVRGIDVREITSATEARPHTLTPWARVEGTKITYPGLPLGS